MTTREGIPSIRSITAMAAAYCWQKPTRLFRKSNKSLPDVPALVDVLYTKWFAGFTKYWKIASALSYSLEAEAEPTAAFTILLTSGGTDGCWASRAVTSGGSDSPPTCRSAVVGWVSETFSV